MGSESFSSTDGSAMRLPEVPTTLMGWGRTPVSTGLVVSPTSASEVGAAIVADGPSAERGVIARGLGRAYGDPAQRAGGRVVDMRFVRDIDVSPDGVVTAGAGASLDDLLDVMVPRGWFVPVTPGTRRVTLGGMIAADVHGKNHHKVGSFGSHVRWIDVRLADGSLRRFEPPMEEFWATVGGMGLTGIIERAAFTASPIETSAVLVDTLRLPDLATAITEMRERDHLYDYTVAWVDLTASGDKLGRSVLTRGRFARRDEIPAARRSSALAFSPKALATMPPIVPSQALNQLTAKAFNTAWFFKSPKAREGELNSIGAFFHPLDAVQEWNRAYGPRGFLQWQFVIPDDATGLLESIVRELVDAKCLSFLTILKRFGDSNPGLLSFPMKGWTLTVDVGSDPRFAPLLNRLDEQIVDAGGRLYLAKDSRMNSALLERMYPRLGTFRAIASALDPTGVFRSDQSVRLNIR